MRPSLSTNGLIVAATGALFVLLGTLLATWPLVALGILQISSLLVLYLLFVPHAAMFRRRRLEFAWWIPAHEVPSGTLTVGQPVQLQLLFRNHSPLTVAAAELTPICSSALEIEGASGSTIQRSQARFRDAPSLRVRIPRTREVRFELSLLPRAAGHWFLQGLALRLVDRFGIFVMHAYFPNRVGVKVFPPLALGAPLPLRPQTGTAHERAGPRLLRRRGLGSDLRELREHVPGDPFKRIAWKATARTGKLMVREHESEILVTHQLLLDISPSMRDGAPVGAQKLDTGLSLCAALARAAIEGGDRVGFSSFDTRLYQQLKPGEGPPQLYRTLERLLELHAVVDEDLTDMTDGELCSAVANYLAYQEGLDVRLPAPPERGSTRWDDIVVGSAGELIDLRMTLREVERSLARQPKRPTLHESSIRASKRSLARLRRFCRLRGIELPYRRSSLVADKGDGMAEALSAAAAARGSRFIVVVSDLLDIENPEVALETLALAKRKRHSLLVLVPGQTHDDVGMSTHERRIRNIVAMRRRREQKQLRRAIRALGVPVIDVASALEVYSVIRSLRGKQLRHSA
ncbi:MAG: hypothetical protein CSA24_02610 [Deltaproteobacteria bacterium]|nr:MAG: hypothetical protein CSB49_01390 [Pseudomonadota bacterium]PIE65518.1 MAG: hypothetical protein CSA24_02610 [Deltaproteobacteria bacterium]